jgi:hypothetical protein
LSYAVVASTARPVGAAVMPLVGGALASSLRRELTSLASSATEPLCTPIAMRALLGLIGVGSVVRKICWYSSTGGHAWVSGLMSMTRLRESGGKSRRSQRNGVCVVIFEAPGEGEGVAPEGDDVAAGDAEAVGVPAGDGAAVAAGGEVASVAAGGEVASVGAAVVAALGATSRAARNAGAAELCKAVGDALAADDAAGDAAAEPPGDADAPGDGDGDGEGVVDAGATHCAAEALPDEEPLAMT